MKTMEELSATNLRVRMSKMKSIIKRRHTVVDPRNLSSSGETNKRVIQVDVKKVEIGSVE